MSTLGLVILIAVALGFDFTNGFHDAANAVATSITTRALRPVTALTMAAGFNVLGALVSTKVAKTVGSGIIATPSGNSGLVVVFAALLGAIAWNLVTWRLGLPSSSTHALIGGLVGAALASAGTVKWHGLVDNVVIPMAVSPLIGLALGYLMMLAILWAFRRARPSRVNDRFRLAQRLSTAAMAYSHGTQDAQKTMGVITLALLITGHLRTFHVPLWVILAAAAAMGLGTFAGGWRIIQTVGSRIRHAASQPRPRPRPSCWCRPTPTPCRFRPLTSLRRRSWARGRPGGCHRSGGASLAKWSWRGSSPSQARPCRPPSAT
jgi:PiT family inorganic phosphate transporter